MFLESFRPEEGGGEMCSLAVEIVEKERSLENCDRGLESLNIRYV